MPRKLSYEPGTPCWVDLATPDCEAAKAFYTGLFGWRAYATPGSPVAGHTTLSLGGDGGTPDANSRVAALMPQPPGVPPGTPAHWTTYITVADVDAAARAAEQAGGRVFLGPTDVPGQCRAALLFDPTGAHVGLWRPAGFDGADVVGEPGAYCWSELVVGDVAGAAAFYRAVLGWAAGDREHATGAYTEWRDPSGTAVAGAVRPDGGQHAGIPPHWAVCFGAADCDAVAARAVELGGTVFAAPRDTAVGRVAMLGDPQGGRFSVIRRAPA